MLNIDDLMAKARGKLSVFKNFRLSSKSVLTEKLTVCIPDMHLLDRGPNDDFFDQRLEYEERFLTLLDFLLKLKKEEGKGLEIIQMGDMFDLWQAKCNTNMIVAAYPSIIGLLDKMETIYVVGNHDIDLVRWYKDNGETFGRRWRHYSKAEGKLRVMYEHGFQAYFLNNQGSWSGIIEQDETKIGGASRSKVFVSYSHTDLKWLRMLQDHLEPLVQQGLIQLWEDTRIKPGSNWRQEIRQAIATAKVAILLVSAPFLGSEFITKNELPPLLAAAKRDGTLILPIVVRPCLFKLSKELEQFQAVNSPDRPLSKIKKANQEEVFVQVAKIILESLSNFKPESSGFVDNKQTEEDRPTPSFEISKKSNTRILIGRMMEYINPDIDEVLKSSWDSVLRVFSQYNACTPVRDPEGFDANKYLDFYVNILQKYNAGKALDQFSSASMDLSLVVIGHTHRARIVQIPKDSRTYYLMDAGSWVNGGHELGVIAGKEMAVCQWDL